MINIKAELREFIEGNSKTLEIETNSIDYWEDVLKESGFAIVEDSYESNGWQVDFWVTFTSIKDGNIILSGSLWYGGFKLSKV